jgi:S1-C subfamily serine protease
VIRARLALGLVLLAGCARPAADDRYTAIYRQLHPSVALLTMEIPADDPKRKGQWDDAYGSGLVVESGGWGSRILTDAHVVDGARDLRARVGDVGKPVAAHVVAVSDEDDDLALVEVATPNLPPARFASGDGIEPGQEIGLLGYPIPDAFEDEKLRTTVSLYAGRVASVRNGTIEVDVPVIPGESGGPVFDGETGEVIGLAESRFEEERAIGFATPVDIVRRFLAAHARARS